MMHFSWARIGGALAFALAIGGLGTWLKNPAAATPSKTNRKTGENPMVLIPGGTFIMGSETLDRDNPAHQVTVDPFFLDRCEVTNAQYNRFCRETGHRWLDDPSLSQKDIP